jgi:hypothetical protein
VQIATDNVEEEMAENGLRNAEEIVQLRQKITELESNNISLQNEIEKHKENFNAAKVS